MCKRSSDAYDQVVPEHGRISDYNAGCRCDLCKQAGSDYHKARYRKRAQCPVLSATEEICGRPLSRDGVCATHYYRLKKKLPLDAPIAKPGTHKRRRDYRKPCNYSAAHSRCVRLWGSPSQYPCVECEGPAEHWAYDGADPDELCSRQRVSEMVFSRYPEFYMPLCRKCHRLRDSVWRKGMKAQFSEFLEWKRAQAS